MNKNFKHYAIAWAILLVIFNVLCFVTPDDSMTKYEGAFWVGYIFITLAFLGQLAVSYSVFKAQNLQKLFYNISLVKISWTGLILTMIFGSICMIIPEFPVWLGVIICVVILGFNAISLTKASAAAEMVSRIDDKIKTQTFFIKMMTADTDSLMARAKDDAARAEVRKVHEAVKYSDPMSNDALSGVEQQIFNKYIELSTAVDEGNALKIKECAERMLQLLVERNNKCKVLK